MKKLKYISVFLLVSSLNIWGYNVKDKFTVNIGNEVNLGFIVTSSTTVSVRYCPTSASGEIAIPSIVNGLHVTKIISGAFEDCNNITSVTIPNSVTDIGNVAFYNCSALASVKIGSGVIHVGENAFTNCNSLTTVRIANLTRWCNIIFEGERSNPVYYAHHLYLGDECISRITIPDSVVTINDYSFTGCIDLSSVVIGNSVKTIGKNAFINCTNLVSVTIGDSVTDIGTYAFAGCSSLTSLRIGNSVKTIGGYAFRDCTNLAFVDLPTSVTNIGQESFRGCYNLSTIEIPYSVKEIGYAAFSWCTKVSEIILHEGVSYIGRSCFAGCNRIKSIILPSSLIAIGAGAFSNCASLYSVVISDSKEPLYFGNDYNEHVFKDCPLDSLYLGRKLEGKYDTSFNRFPLSSVVINNTDDYAFQECTNLTNVEFLDNVSQVPESSFSLCRNLKNVVFSDNITSIAEKAFNTSQSQPLNKLTLPRNLISIGKAAFCDCRIDTLVIPDAVEAISEEAFRNCHLKFLILGKSVTTIGFNAFENSLPDTVYVRNPTPPPRNYYALGKAHFFVPYGTKDLYKKAWASSNGIKTYHDYYFDGQDYNDTITSNNSNIVLEYTITNIALHEVCLNKVICETEINNLEMQSNNFGELDLNVVEISENAFAETPISNIILPATTSFIRNSAFANCVKLNSIVIPVATTKIEEAFINCISLREVNVFWRKPAGIDVCEENFDGIPEDATLYVPAGTKERYAALSPWNKFSNIIETGPISPGDISAKNGGKAKLPIYLNNEQAIAGMQFKLTLPDGVTVAEENENLKTSVTERSSDMTIMGRKDPDEINSYLFVPISFTGTPISGNEGAIMNINLEVADDMPLGKYDIKLEEITMATTSYETIQPSEVTAELTIRDLIVGDANDDNAIDIADYSAIVASILGHAAENFIDGADDLNNDDVIDVSDLSALAYMILHPYENSAGSKQFKAAKVVAEELEDSDPAEYDNTIYASPVIGGVGSQTTLSINMKNSIEATGFQFDIYLPDGVSFALDEDDFPLAELSEKRTTAKRTNTFDCALQPDGALRILCNSTGGYAFNGNDGEVATIVLDIAQALNNGDYPIIIKNIVITDATGNQRFTVEQMKSTLTVGETAPEIAYDKGYIVEFTPFAIDTNGGGEATVDINFIVSPEVTQSTKVEFDLIIPQEWYENYMIGEVIKNSSLGSRFYTLTDPIDNGNGSYHFALAAKSAAYYFGKKETTKVGSFQIYQDGGGDEGDYIIPEGIYDIDIKNVIITGTDGETYNATPYKGNMFVGTPKATPIEGVIAFAGDYSNTETLALLTNALPSEDTNITAVDLTWVNAIAEGTLIDLTNNNCLIYVSEGITLANSNNVIIGNVCDNLVIEDMKPFSVPKAFTATTAEYARTMTNEWGTIFLPYAISSDENMELYNITGIDNGNLVVEKIDKLAAGTPALVRKVNGTGINPTATDVPVSATINNATNGTVTMYGSYEEKKIDNANAYYIKSNKFWQCNNYFYCDPFRAYFVADNAGSNSFGIVISDDELTGISDIASANADKAVAIYSIDGKRLGTLQQGVNIVKLSNGSTKKVVVK